MISGFTSLELASLIFLTAFSKQTLYPLGPFLRAKNIFYLFCYMTAHEVGLTLTASCSNAFFGGGTSSVAKFSIFSSGT